MAAATPAPPEISTALMNLRDIEEAVKSTDVRYVKTILSVSLQLLDIGNIPSNKDLYHRLIRLVSTRSTALLLEVLEQTGNTRRMLQLEDEMQRYERHLTTMLDDLRTFALHGHRHDGNHYVRRLVATIMRRWFRKKLQAYSIQIAQFNFDNPLVKYVSPSGRLRISSDDNRIPQQQQLPENSNSSLHDDHVLINEEQVKELLLRISHESVDLVPPITDLFSNSAKLSLTDLIGFIREAAHLLQNNVPLFHSFVSVIPAEHAKVTYKVYEDAIDTIVVKSSSGGRIYPISEASRIDPPTIQSTGDIKHYLTAEDTSWAHFTSLPSRWAGGVAELVQMVIDPGDSKVSANVQQELDVLSDDVVYRRRCLTCLRKLALQYGVLPDSFFLSDVVCNDRYPLSAGGYADIWKGYHKTHNDICLKVLRIFQSEEERREETFREFAHEALLWKQLYHQNILPFLGVNLEIFRPSFSLISPWMHRGTVASLLDISPAYHERLTILLHVCRGLKYLHSLNPQTIHGDIKGSNILVSDDWNFCLADFGLASFSETQDNNNSDAAPTCGSTRWLAPEMLMPQQLPPAPPTSRDIYALACTILEIYTGSPPFSYIKHDITVTIKVVSGDRPPRPTSMGAELDELWDIVTRAWSQDALLRPDINEIHDVVAKLHAKWEDRSYEPVSRARSSGRMSMLPPPAMEVVHCKLTSNDLEYHLNRIILLALPLLSTEWKREAQTLVEDCKIWRSCEPEKFVLSFERFGDHLIRLENRTRQLQHRVLLEVYLEDELRHSSALSSALRTAKQAMEKLFEVKPMNY